MEHHTYRIYIRVISMLSEKYNLNNLFSSDKNKAFAMTVLL